MLNRIRKSVSGEKGFTLVELLVVIGIIGILAMMLLPQFRGMRDRARIASCQSNLKNVGTTLEAFYADNERYPVNQAAFDLAVAANIRTCPHDTVAYVYFADASVTSAAAGVVDGMPAADGPGPRYDSFVVYCSFHDGSAATEPEHTQLYVTQDGVMRKQIP